MTGHHAAGHGEHAHNPNLQHHFYSMEQQLEASILGMWVFLVTEIMFFGGMFMIYILYRILYPEAWVLGSNHLNVALGALNTGVLIVQLAHDGAGGAIGPDRHRRRDRSSI